MYEGVNMKGLYTSVIRNNTAYVSFPDNYYDDSFKLIKAAGMNHIRYVIYWQAFENDPVSFLDELQLVASMADNGVYKLSMTTTSIVHQVGLIP